MNRSLKIVKLTTENIGEAVVNHSLLIQVI